MHQWIIVQNRSYHMAKFNLSLKNYKAVLNIWHPQSIKNAALHMGIKWYKRVVFSD